MIDEIQVQNLALIRDAVLEPVSGLTVLTGETGAGKTALLSALKLLMGQRADKTQVREGTDALCVTGRFFVPSGGDDGLIAQRTVTQEGRSRVKLDGRMASVNEMAELVAPTIDLCGQHEHQQLLKVQNHVAMLDAWAGAAAVAAREAYEEAFSAAREAQAAFDRVQEASLSESAKLDEARFVLNRIESVNPQEGEYEELLESLGRAEHAEALATAVHTAYEALSGESGAMEGLDCAASALEDVARFDARLGACAESLREAGYVLEDISREALRYRDGIEFDPDMLQAQQERINELQGLLRAYGPRMEDVFSARDEAAELVSLVDDAEFRIRAAQKAVDAAEAVLAEAAKALAEVREEAAPRFAVEVSAQMQRLCMGSAELVCSTEDLPRSAWTRAGSQAIEFLFRPGFGMQARPLARIASGGEVSRVMLAIKVVLGQADAVDTLVFDEVDAGVGGATAVALAEVLADLALTHQVIVVTHLAQVAVCGQAHYVVRKTMGADGSIPETQLIRLSDAERPAEIARMLSGDVTEASLANAREMLSA